MAEAMGFFTDTTVCIGCKTCEVACNAANGLPPSAVIIDNGSPGTSTTGTWPASTAVTGFEGSNYQTRQAGTGSNLYTWTTTLPSAGNYKIYARWTSDPNRATNASYTIQTQGGNQTTTVNQQLNTASWQLLGTYAMTTSAAVTLTDQANGYVVADAVMFIADNAAPNTATCRHRVPRFRRR